MRHDGPHLLCGLLHLSNDDRLLIDELLLAQLAGHELLDQLSLSALMFTEGPT